MAYIRKQMDTPNATKISHEQSRDKTKNREIKKKITELRKKKKKTLPPRTNELMRKN